MSTNPQSRASIQGDRLLRIVGKRVGACAACVLLLGATRAHAAPVVTDTVVSRSTQTQNNVPVTFGQVFKAGDVPAGATLTASLDGQPVTLQVDAKATNPDGSLRHAVLTVMVPWLSGGTNLPLTLATGSAPASGSPITLSQLLATGYDARASLDIGGKHYSINARGLLQAADNAQACSAWDTQCNLWLSGPLVSAWVVNGPVTASDGTTNPNLRIYFAVRAYAGTAPGTVGQVRTDIIVENTHAFAPQGQPQYIATLTSGSASYTSPALTQYTATRWHKVLWWNNTQPHVYLQQDTQYIQDSKAVSRYMPLTPDESFLASLPQTYAPLDHGDQMKDMGATGAQPGIGPLPRWTSVYIIDPDVRAYHWMLANTDALGTYSAHYRDGATGWPLSIEQHPYVTIAGWSGAKDIARQDNDKGRAYKRDLLPSTSTSWYATGNPYKWDNAHQPAAGYVAYMVTGSYYYMEELAFYASMNTLWPNPSYREFSKGLIDKSYLQTRGKAWVLRDMVDAAWLLPDSYPLKAEFNTIVNNSIADFNAKYTNNPNANSLGLMPSAVKPYRQYTIAPYQHSYLTWAVNHAAELGYADAAEFRNWLAKFDIGLMTDWIADPTHGYCWLMSSAYNIRVQTDDGAWLPNYAAIYAANFPTLVGLACNSPDMVAAVGKQQGEPWQQGEMRGFADSATGFPSNAQTGLAAIADSGLPNAAEAWQIFISRTVKPQGGMAYNNYPNFAVLPRSATGSVPPPTEPPPSTTPPPTEPPPSTTPAPSTPLPAAQPPSTPPASAAPPSATPPPVERTPVARSVWGSVWHSVWSPLTRSVLPVFTSPRPTTLPSPPQHSAPGSASSSPVESTPEGESTTRTTGLVSTIRSLFPSLAGRWSSRMPGEGTNRQSGSTPDSSHPRSPAISGPSPVVASVHPATVARPRSSQVPPTTEKIGNVSSGPWIYRGSACDNSSAPSSGGPTRCARK